MIAITWVTEALGFGAIGACVRAGDASGDYACVHACKHPCHCRAAGYDKTLPKDHPHYLALEQGGHLYMNLIDPPVPLFQIESFAIFFDFVDRHLHKKKLVIHCNKGESRAPSLAMLVMAKRLGLIPDESYAAAREAFAAQYPYKPGKGLTRFLQENWTALG